mmetsp:Transcript_9323/g.42427  ORF Transcript_9323/g.42427 Transcript_9323/m.42427 type:complete len:337 (+) Transcript_9323:873-1883(+)
MNKWLNHGLVIPGHLRVRVSLLLRGLLLLRLPFLLRDEELPTLTLPVRPHDRLLVLGDFTAEDGLSQGRLQQVLHRALHRPRAKAGIVASLAEHLKRRLVHAQANLAVLEPTAHALHLLLDDLSYLAEVQRIEYDVLVDAVDKLRSVVPADSLHHPLPPVSLGAVAVVVHALEHELRADVRRHDQDGVLEVHHPSLAVRHAAVVQDLEQHVEDVAVRLLHLVEEDDAVGPAPHSLRELATFLEADVTRGRADEPGHRVLLHVLAHVDSDHGLLRVEEEGGERLGELRLAHAGGSEEHEGRDGTVGIGQTRARALDSLRDCLHRGILADDALVQLGG